MNSHARLTYDQVGAMLLDGDPALCEQYAAVLPHLHDLYGLYRLLHEARAERGAIDFDTVETRFQFDDQGKLAAIVPLQRHDAHKVIEECMLAANVAAARSPAAQEACRLSVPEYTTRPGAAKLDRFGEFLGPAWGRRMDGGTEPSPRISPTFLDRVGEQPRLPPHPGRAAVAFHVQAVLARGSTLATSAWRCPAYTHFTSPIRRYPDLIVHRAIQARADRAGGLRITPRSSTWKRWASIAQPLSAGRTRRSVTHRAAKVRVHAGQGGRVVRRHRHHRQPASGSFIELDDDLRRRAGSYHGAGLRLLSISTRWATVLTGERTGRVYRLGDASEVQGRCGGHRRPQDRFRPRRKGRGTGQGPGAPEA